MSQGRPANVWKNVNQRLILLITLFPLPPSFLLTHSLAQIQRHRHNYGTKLSCVHKQMSLHVAMFINPSSASSSFHFTSTQTYNFKLISLLYSIRCRCCNHPNCPISIYSTRAFVFILPPMLSLLANVTGQFHQLSPSLFNHPETLFLINTLVHECNCHYVFYLVQSTEVQTVTTRSKQP